MENPQPRAITIQSAELEGLESTPVYVEVHASGGLPGVDIVGLADPCVRESKQRVRAALSATGFRFPEERITINLAPASTKKVGAGLDLPMAVGILLACGKVEFTQDGSLNQTLLIGELSLSGHLRAVSGAVNAAVMAKRRGLKSLIVPVANAGEAKLVSGLNILPANHLQEVIEHFQNLRPLPVLVGAKETAGKTNGNQGVRLEDIRGQSLAKKALLVAAAGGHNLLFVGPPGSGKTLLARALPGLLPELDEEQALETTCIYNVLPQLRCFDKLITTPPFRMPHHSMSDAGLIGGGRSIQPGELSLAHNGVLFLDELPEFRRNVLEVLRSPLESGQVILSRASGVVSYPAKIQMIAAMNPCPCGYSGSKESFCRCSPNQVHHYVQKISGPLLDRIDIRMSIGTSGYGELLRPGGGACQTSDEARKTIVSTQEIWKKRYKSENFKKNAHIPFEKIEVYCPLQAASRKALDRCLEKRKMSARGVHRFLRVARTLADLKGIDGHIEPDEIFEAEHFWQDPFSLGR